MTTQKQQMLIGMRADYFFFFYLSSQKCFQSCNREGRCWERLKEAHRIKEIMVNEEGKGDNIRVYDKWGKGRGRNPRTNKSYTEL